MTVSRRVAFCGCMCALAMLWLIATVFPYATLAFSALAGLMLAPVALELGSKFGWMCFGATALLAILMVPDPSAKLSYVLFFGFYPIVQLRINLWNNRYLAWGIKVLMFNVAATMAVLLSVFLADVLQAGIIADLTLPLLVLGVPAANVVFVMYDIALWRMIGVYRTRLHPLVTLWLR